MRNSSSPHSPDSFGPPPRVAPKEWEEHEQVTPTVEVEAKRLLEAAGAKERAKHAIDAVAGRNELQEDSEQQDDAATDGAK